MVDVYIPTRQTAAANVFTALPLDDCLSSSFCDKVVDLTSNEGSLVHREIDRFVFKSRLQWIDASELRGRLNFRGAVGPP